ncbi:MAG: hypothetical protein OEZ47_12235 [Gammaproteobacteria bacterium]|nr:hypothetical protein [Gammaproteobacteria bacterium]
MNNQLKYKLQEILWGSMSILAGAAVVYIGQHMLLGVRFELFYGISTFNLAWITSLFFIPFLGGIVVSLVYGLGGKILSHFSPLLILIPDYLEVKDAILPEGVNVLPFGYWFLLVIVAMEFCALGGIVGEVLTKKTYGRSPKQKFHVKYANNNDSDIKEESIQTQSLGDGEQK